MFHRYRLLSLMQLSKVLLQIQKSPMQKEVMYHKYWPGYKAFHGLDTAAI